MNEAEYRSELHSILLMAALIPKLNICEVLQAMERAETVGSIIDPTLFVKAGAKLQRQKELVEAALEFQRAINAILDQETDGSQRGGGDART